MTGYSTGVTGKLALWNMAINANAHITGENVTIFLADGARVNINGTATAAGNFVVNNVSYANGNYDVRIGVLGPASVAVGAATLG